MGRKEVMNGLQELVERLESVHDNLDSCNTQLYKTDCEESKELESIFRQVREAKEELEEFIKERA